MSNWISVDVEMSGFTRAKVGESNDGAMERWSDGVMERWNDLVIYFGVVNEF